MYEYFEQALGKFLETAKGLYWQTYHIVELKISFCMYMLGKPTKRLPIKLFFG